MSDTRVPARGGRLQMPRSRGAASGFLLILLGAWGALIPFVGPYFDFAFPPDQEWTWTIARGWLEVLPGAATVVGGLLLLGSRNRVTAMVGGWLTVLAGAWFVVGRALAGPLGIGDVGAPVAVTDDKRVWLELTYFYGLGALIVFLGALHARRQAELVVHVAQVGLHRPRGDEQPGGDVLVRYALADESHDIDFGGCERAPSRRWPLPFAATAQRVGDCLFGGQRFALGPGGVELAVAQGVPQRSD